MPACARSSPLTRDNPCPARSSHRAHAPVIAHQQPPTNRPGAPRPAIFGRRCWRASLHTDSLRPFIDARRRAGVRTKSINNALGVVRWILNLAARSWRDDHGLTWLDVPPLIAMLPVTDGRKSYPLDWDEERRLIRELPKHLGRMVLFKVNTGTREQEVCRPRWEWEVEVPMLKTSVFPVPADDEHGRLVKNGGGKVSSSQSSCSNSY